MCTLNDFPAKSSINIHSFLAAISWAIIQLYSDPIVRVLTAGFAIIIGYICIKLLGENTVTAYQRAKVSSINIVTPSEPIPSTSQDLRTISQKVEIEQK